MTIVIALLVGMLVGVAGLARLYAWRLNDPDVVRQILKNCYRTSHPNWLQVSKDDTTRVCPCCGWSEKEGLAAGAEKCPGKTVDAAVDPLACNCGAERLDLKGKLQRMGGDERGASVHDVGCPAREVKS